MVCSLILPSHFEILKSILLTVTVFIELRIPNAFFKYSFSFLDPHNLKIAQRLTVC